MIDERDVKRLAELAGLEIDPAFLPGVTRNLETLLDQAALLMAPPLAAEIEPAPVFRP
jgi:Asp-tRNA(Asn)/Glu-tRNA(Gln) amidotransferase C subunit